MPYESIKSFEVFGLDETRPYGSAVAYQFIQLPVSAFNEQREAREWIDRQETRGMKYVILEVYKKP